jgi:hypothetical protein
MRLGLGRLTDPVLEVLLFRVGGARFAVTLNQVVGLVRDLPDAKGQGAPLTAEPQTMFFEGQEVPVFPAEDFLHDVGPGVAHPSEAIIFDDGEGYYGVAVDATESVLCVTPGDGLYMLPPQEATDMCPCRAWGVLTVAERFVILLDMSRVAVH